MVQRKERAEPLSRPKARKKTMIVEAVSRCSGDTDLDMKGKSVQMFYDLIMLKICISILALPNKSNFKLPLAVWYT